nr:hypothetical protein pmam_153 [Pithovirus mammoth]
MELQIRLVVLLFFLLLVLVIYLIYRKYFYSDYLSIDD